MSSPVTTDNWPLVIHKEITLDSQLTLYKFQMNPNFNIRNKIKEAPEENKSLGWEKALIFIEYQYFPLCLLEFVIKAKARNPTGLEKKLHHKQNQKAEDNGERNKQVRMTKSLAVGRGHAHQ